MKVRQAQVPSGEASPITIRKRTQSLANIRHTVTAHDSTPQLAHEVHLSEQRHLLLDEIKKIEGSLVVQVPVEASLAMKADLNIPWNKLRVIRRYWSSLIMVTNNNY